ncbi:hypothetical protein [Actinomycetospora sp. NBRC 106378]|uniref:hypothetical protein n=1 Tax=Actinomycetospora sp. NBRC 106378 TaxID=3032208 RepID=UPI002555EAAB|nr:hypothetical protein [Actinomycetospora sp. NBRC 106378]
MPKAGNTDAEWEDGVATDPGHPGSGRPVRVAIADGATAAYGARRWAAELTAGFASPRTAPAGLDPTMLTHWFGDRQAAWSEGCPAVGTVLEELKVAEGSFATFAGCVLDVLAGPGARWEAATLGDSVLFHVRSGALVAHLPPLGPDDFGRDPAGAFTRPDALLQMAQDLVCGRGELVPGDHLFLATDALAQWMVRRADKPETWEFLARLSHPAEFSRFVTTERDADAMTNDDVTLLRVSLSPTAPRRLVVCR